MDDVRLCIIGAGSLSTKRIYPYVGAAGAQLVGVCDLDAERAARNARRFGGMPYTDLTAMLDAEEPDGVIICVGPEGHAALAPQVLRLGFPVYTEKPPAPTAQDALQVARVAQETGRLCMTAFKKRYSAAYARAKQWIESFDPSDLYSLSVDYASAQYSNESLRTSFLLDFAIHAIDLVGYLFGDASEVFAFSKGKDAYAVSIRFANGAVGSMNLNDGRSFRVPTEEVELTARGGNFMTISNSSRWRITADGVPTEWREPSTFTSSGDSGLDTGHLAEIIDFVEAIRDGRTTRSNIAESYRSMVLYEAIRDSSETGAVVQVAYETI
ncbi:Gfo/Idh/MocA family oxidoreductase [Candidatus Poribacteria bacterium]|nr:Gfo/Idh/MocA family oxidoreductase [Candidatus Poribacteria bacterium]